MNTITNSVGERVGHTAGPWRVVLDETSDDPLAIFQDDGTGNGNHIKLVAGDPETGANLALIEAAPELLAALLELVERSKENPMEALGIGLMAVKTRTLIAKATSTQS